MAISPRMASDPAEGAAHEQEQGQRADGIGRDPLRGQRQAEQDADGRHRQPGRGQRDDHQPVQTAAKSAYAATMNSPT